MRVALAARDPFCVGCGRTALAGLSEAIRNCIGGADCDEVWVDQILGVLGHIARNLPDRVHGTGGGDPVDEALARALGESSPTAAVACEDIACLRYQITRAMRFFSPRMRRDTAPPAGRIVLE